MKKIRQILETAAVSLAAWLFPKLPRRIVLLLAKGVGALAYLLDARGRRTAHENLRVAFAREHISLEQIRRIALGSYQTFARTFIDFFCSTRLTKENFHESIHIRAEDETTEELAHSGSGIWITPHFGNFELVSYIWGFRGFPFVLVAQDFDNPDLTTIFKRLREGSGHTVIPQQGAMLRLMKTLSKHGYAALLTDLNIKPGKMAAALRCFGLLTCSTTLHTSLALRLNVPIFSCTCAPLPDGDYLVRVNRAFVPSSYDTPAAMAQAVWDVFEERIRETPEAWMWMYKHWRYLPTPKPDNSYPNYAQYWKEFAKLTP